MPTLPTAVKLSPTGSSTPQLTPKPSSQSIAQLLGEAEKRKKKPSGGSAKKKGKESLIGDYILYFLAQIEEPKPLPRLHHHDRHGTYICVFYIYFQRTYQSQKERKIVLQTTNDLFNL